MVEQRTVPLSAAAASAGQQCCTPCVGQMLAEDSLTPRPTQSLPARVATPLLPADTRQACSSWQEDMKHHSWSGLTTNSESFFCLQTLSA